MDNTGFIKSDGRDVGLDSLEKLENLNDLPNKADARTNLGLGSMATATIGHGIALPQIDGVKSQILATDGLGNVVFKEAEGTEGSFVTKPTLVALDGIDVLEYDGTQYTFNVSSSQLMDPDASVLTYKWAITGGFISSTEGASVEWAFNNGNASTSQIISVYAEDDQGNKSKTVSITVTVGITEAPVINNISFPTNAIAGITQQLDVDCYNGGDAYNLTYKWESSEDNGLTWDTERFSHNRIKNPTISIEDEHVGVKIKCTIQNLVGASSSTVSMVVAAYIPLSLDSLTVPSPVVADGIVNNILNAAVTGGGGVTAIMWHVSTDNETTWIVEGISNSSIFNPTYVTDQIGTRIFRLTVSNEIETLTAKSSSVLSIAAPIGASLTVPVDPFANEVYQLNALISDDGGDPTLDYAWQVSYDGGTIWGVAGLNNSIIANPTWTTTESGQDIKFKCDISNDVGSVSAEATAYLWITDGNSQYLDTDPGITLAGIEDSYSVPTQLQQPAENSWLRAAIDVQFERVPGIDVTENAGKLVNSDRTLDTFSTGETVLIQGNTNIITNITDIARESILTDQLAVLSAVPTIAPPQYSTAKFKIDGEDYLVMASYYDGEYDIFDCPVYKYDGTQFQLLQNIPLAGTYKWSYFEINGEHYLSAACFRDGDDYSGVVSPIYKWDGTQFQRYQDLYVAGCMSTNYFTYSGKHFLLATTYRDGLTYSHNSKVYEWNGSEFAFLQNIATHGSMKSTHFEMGGDLYIGISNYRSDATGYNSGATVYKYNGTNFSLVQTLVTKGCKNIVHFEMGGEHFLWLPRYYNYLENTSLYKWNGSTFVHHQYFPVNSAGNLEFFEMGGVGYIAIPERYDGTTNDLDSHVYKWNGSTFALHQSIATHNSEHMKHFEMNGEQYLFVGSGLVENDSELYKWNGTTFVLIQSITTYLCFDTIYFETPDKNCLLVVNYRNTVDEISYYRLDSFVYTFNRIKCTYTVANSFSVNPTAMELLPISLHTDLTYTLDPTVKAVIENTGKLEYMGYDKPYHVGDPLRVNGDVELDTVITDLERSVVTAEIGRLVNDGTEQSFNLRGTRYVSSIMLDATHVCVSYQDYGNSNQGVSVVGTIDGNSIIWGDKVVFNSGLIYFVTSVMLDSTHVMINYQDNSNNNYGTSIIGTISGNVITFGNEYIFNAGEADAGVSTKIDATHVMISYTDYGNSGRGTSIIATIAGSVITFGSEVVFNSSITTRITSVMLDATHVCISYVDNGNSLSGTAIVGIISGDVIAFGSEVVFNIDTISYNTSVMLDATHAMFIYRDEGNSSYGTAIIGTISGNVIAFGNKNIFNNATTNYIFPFMLDATRVCIAYEDGANSYYGVSVVGVIDEDNIAWGNKNIFSDTFTRYISAAMLDATRVIIGYSDNSVGDFGFVQLLNYDTDTNLTVISIEDLIPPNVLTIEQVVESSEFYTELAASGNDLEVIHAIDEPYAINSRVKVGGTKETTALVTGVVSTPYDIEPSIESWILSGNISPSGTTDDISLAMLDETHVVAAYLSNASSGMVVIGTISGTDVTWGTPVEFNNSDTPIIITLILSNTKFAICYQDHPATYYPGRIIIGDVSGDVITLGTESSSMNTELNAMGISAVVIDSTHILTTFMNYGGFNGTSRIATIDGTNVTWGSLDTYHNNYTLQPHVVMLDSTHALVSWTDHLASQYGRAKIGTISGTDVTWGNAFTYSSTITSNSKCVVLDNTHVLISYTTGSITAGGPGYSLIATIDGTSITYGNAFLFSNTVHRLSSVILDDGNIVISYKNNSDSKGYSVLTKIVGINIVYDAPSIHYDGTIASNTHNSTIKFGDNNILVGYSTADNASYTVGFYKNKAYSTILSTNTVLPALSLTGSFQLPGNDYTYFATEDTAKIKVLDVDDEPYIVGDHIRMVGDDTVFADVTDLDRSTEIAPATVFNTTLFIGSEQDRNIDVGFQPDLVWIKDRDDVNYHNIFDSVRGAGNAIWTNHTSGQISYIDNLKAFTKNGFDLGTRHPTNEIDHNFVVWSWMANKIGAIDNGAGLPQIEKYNEETGLSIIKYTGNGVSGRTLAHSLGAKPAFFTVKGTSIDGLSWLCYSSALGATKWLILNSDSLANITAAAWNNQEPDASNIVLGNSSHSNQDGVEYIAYIWTEIPGYSSFGSYTGNADIDGPEIDCGFEPEFVMVKRTDVANTWVIYDKPRDPNALHAESTEVEGDSTAFSFEDYGFKITHGGTNALNASGGNYIYMAFGKQADLTQKKSLIGVDQAIPANVSSIKQVGINDVPYTDIAVDGQDLTILSDNEVTYRTNEEIIVSDRADVETKVTGITRETILTDQADVFQNILTTGASGSSYFEIDGESYMAVASFYDGSSYNTNSVIYKWNGSKFVSFQNIATHGCASMTYFEIGGDKFLAVSNANDGTTYTLNNTIYKWDGIRFVSFQDITAMACTQMEYFEMSGESYLAVTEVYMGIIVDSNSFIHKWNGSTFVLVQTMALDRPSRVLPFEMNGEYYLARSQFYSAASNSYNTVSPIYKWNGTQFIPDMTLNTRGCQGFEYFEIGVDKFLVAVNARDDDYLTTSTIYKWNGTSFDIFLEVPTQNCPSIKYFEVDGESYLTFINNNNGTTKVLDSPIYKWNGTTFVFHQNIVTSGGGYVNYFVMNSRHYLFVSNGNSGITWVQDSPIYTFNREKSVFTLEDAPQADPTSITQSINNGTVYDNVTKEDNKLVIYDDTEPYMLDDVVTMLGNPNDRNATILSTSRVNSEYLDRIVSVSSENFGTGIMYFIDITKINDNQVIAAFRNDNNAQYGSAMLGTIVGNSVIWDQQAIAYIAVGCAYQNVHRINDSQFVIVSSCTSQAGKIVVGTIDSEAIGGITFGATYDFGGGTMADVSSVLIDNKTLCIIHRDTTVASGAKVVVGTISGEVITLGTPVIIETDLTRFTSITALDSNHVCIQWSANTTETAYACVGTISNTSIVLGSKYSFGNVDHFTDMVALDSNHVCICWGLDAVLSTVVGTISGDVITFGETYIVDGAYYPSMQTLDSTHVCIFKRSSFEILKITGTEIKSVSTIVNKFGMSYSGSGIINENHIISVCTSSSGLARFSIVELGYKSKSIFEVSDPIPEVLTGVTQMDHDIVYQDIDSNFEIVDLNTAKITGLLIGDSGDQYDLKIKSSNKDGKERDIQRIQIDFLS